MTRCNRQTIRALLSSLCLLSFISASLSKPYKYLTYAQIHKRLVELVDANPKLLRMYSAQQTFLLPHVGNCTQFQSATDTDGTSTPCTVWVVELSNLETLPSNPTRPEMLVSGLLHGDEVVGPHVVLAFIEHMVESYATDGFVKRMVDTRLVTLIPMTNAVGFSNGERIERQIEGNKTLLLDPNRDFGFAQDPEKCMQTVAARVINELFRMHLFRILITFHGGTNALGYEWGDTHHCNGPICDPAPDTGILKALATRMSSNAGPAGSYEAVYPVGDMGKLVYPVSGGLEDWAYGASWSGQGVSCTPHTLGGYSKEKTRPETVQKRCVTYLVETARAKKPTEHELGDSDALMHKGAPGDGHVPRNFRLILTAMDSLDPYVVLHSTVTVNEHKRPVLAWTVSGSFLVDGTAIQWSTINGEVSSLSDSMSGAAGVRDAGGTGGSFSAQLLGVLPTSYDPVYVRIAAVVDQKFAVQPNGSNPDVTPQSHLMGSRASSKWDFNVKGHQVHGRQVFYSRTRKLSRSSSGGFVLSDFMDVDWTSRSKSDSEVFGLLAHGSNAQAPGGGILQPFGGGAVGIPLTVMTGAAGVLIILSIAVAIYVCARRKRGRSRVDRGRHSFALMDDEEEEERKALAPENAGFGREDEEVLSVSGIRP